MMINKMEPTTTKNQQNVAQLDPSMQTIPNNTRTLFEHLIINNTQVISNNNILFIRDINGQILGLINVIGFLNYQNDVNIQLNTNNVDDKSANININTPANINNSNISSITSSHREINRNTAIANIILFANSNNMNNTNTNSNSIATESESNPVN